MSGFNFRLQKVLDLRLWKEQERAGQLSAARQEMEKAAQALENLSAVRSATRDQIALAHGAGGTVGHLRNLREVLNQLDARIEEAAGRHQAAEENVQESLARYTEALQERRILERLREKQEEASRIAENQAEQKALDEIAVTRYTRASPGEDEEAR